YLGRGVRREAHVWRRDWSLLVHSQLTTVSVRRAAGQGLEPRISAPEADVLPLHQPALGPLDPPGPAARLSLAGSERFQISVDVGQGVLVGHHVGPGLQQAP